MYSDKKRTKEDTWRPADLKRHIREGEHDDDHVRRRADDRKHRGGESTERRHRDPDKESRRERDKLRDRESTAGRHEDRDYTERRKEGSRDRRGDKDRDRDREKRKERDRLVEENKHSDEYRDNRDRRHHREEKHDRERRRDKDRYKEEDRDNRREDRDRERRREERDRERRSDRERRRHEESGEERRHETDRQRKENREHHGERERHRNEDQDRHGNRKYSKANEDKEYNEERGKQREESERRHRDRRHHDEKRKHDSESRDHRDLKGSGGEVRHHRGDRDHADKERRHRDDGEAERKHRERRHREDDDHHQRKHRERRHREEEEEEEEEDRERKHQERKPKEDGGQERDRRDRTGSQKHSTDKRPNEDTVKTETVETVSGHGTVVKDEGETEKFEAKDEDPAYGEYEDDFEDYEEDFEEMDESAHEGGGEDDEEPPQPEESEEREEITAQQRKEIEAIQRAIDEENERVGTAQSRQSTGTEEDRPKWSKGSEVKENDTSQRGRFIDFVAAKQREVSKKVASKQKKRSTELLRLIDLDFSMTFSLLDLQPVNEYDMYIRNFGTANTRQAYVQCHEDDADRDIQTEEIETCEKWTQHPAEHFGACGDPNLSQEARDKATSELNFDSQRLASFLRSASQVMVVLMEEDRAERKSLGKLKAQTDALSFSDGSLQLNTKLPFLYGRQVSLVHFSQVQRHTMMSVHMPTSKPSAVRLDSYTVICIWNIWEPSRPQKILVYESEVQCCCFSPGKAILVFAGTSVGSVLLWDLREHASNHYHLQIGEEEWTFRQPTFSTDAVLACSGHFTSVTSIEVVPSPVAGGLRPEVPLLASEEESSGLSFQLVSLDESGAVNFWVVVELPRGNEAGSPVDLGLRPGGKVKLLHSSSLLVAERASPRDAVKTGPFQTLLLKFLPTDSNHFFIGTNMGLVSHGTSHGLKAPPKFYRFQEVEVRPVDVTSIHFSPFKQHLFLVGCGNGSVRLHDVSREQPVAQWTTSTAGEPVVSLQWAQTRPTVFCVLDAASNLHIWDLMKSDAEPVLTERMAADRVTAMAVFGDSGQQNTYSGVALAHESGKIEMQYFTRNLTVSSSAEEDKLESLMTEAF